MEHYKRERRCRLVPGPLEQADAWLEHYRVFWAGRFAGLSAHLARHGIEAAGWELVRTRGSHRHYRHPKRPGLVTIAGKPSDTLHPKTWASIIRQSGLDDDDA